MAICNKVQLRYSSTLIIIFAMIIFHIKDFISRLTLNQRRKGMVSKTSKVCI